MVQALSKTRNKYTFKKLRSYTVKMFSNFLLYKNLISYSVSLRTIHQSQVKNVKYIKPMFHKLFHGTRNNVFRITNIRQINEQRNIDVLKTIASIQNNVILYKNEKTSDTIAFKLLFYGWLCCNIVLALVTYNPKYIATWSTCKSWLEYVKQNGTNLMYFTYSISIGPLALVLLYQLNKRFVRYIILHKGGAKISLITNHLYKRNYTLTVPVEKVKVTVARTDTKNYLPLKIQNKKFYYLVDGQGKFLNHVLFDYTLGAQKNW